jgi:hypothetical protein
VGAKGLEKLSPDMMKAMNRILLEKPTSMVISYSLCAGAIV